MRKGAAVLRFDRSFIVNADCVAGAKQYLADGSVDLIVTDPPYGIEGDKLHRHYNRDERFVTGGYVEVPAGEYHAFTRAWIAQAERVLRPGGQIYVVSGYTRLFDVLAALRATSLREINHIIWKYNFGVFTRRKFVSSHYHILYWGKPGAPRTFRPEARHAFDEMAPGGGSLNYRDREDVWMINREYKPGREKNKNELPIALVKKMIAYSSLPGDLVCDFFVGGGSTAKAAAAMGRSFAGFEISEHIFKNRLAHLQLGRVDEDEAAPRPYTLRNFGKSWSPADDEHLATRWRALRETGVPKTAIVRSLSGEFERGCWSIRKRLKHLEAPSST